MANEYKTANLWWKSANTRQKRGWNTCVIWDWKGQKCKCGCACGSNQKNWFENAHLCTHASRILANLGHPNTVVQGPMTSYVGLYQETLVGKIDHPPPLLGQPWYLTRKTHHHHRLSPYYPGWRFPGQRGQKPFFPPNSWWCAAWPSLHSTHESHQILATMMCCSEGQLMSTASGLSMIL